MSYDEFDDDDEAEEREQFIDALIDRKFDEMKKELKTDSKERKTRDRKAHRYRCIGCGARFTEEEFETLDECPKCGSTTVERIYS